MTNYRVETFTDREEAMEVFKQIYSREPDQPWPMLPILSFIAPGGVGKTTLVDHLIADRCRLSRRKIVLPHAYLDFSLKDTPRESLQILVDMRNQLRKQTDERGHHLAFPRFDLGAAIALTAPRDGHVLPYNREQIKRVLKIEGQNLINSLNPLASAAPKIPDPSKAPFISHSFLPLLKIAPVIPPLIYALKLASNINEVQDFLLKIKKGPGWQWYQTRTIDLALEVNASISDVLLSLYDMMSDTKSSRQLISELLPDAFLADLSDALDGPHPPAAWNKRVSVIIFLDNFHIILNDDRYTGVHLLERLALTKHREGRKSDPLLLVVCSQQYLHSDSSLYSSAKPSMTVHHPPAPQELPRNQHKYWQQLHETVQKARSDLQLDDLCMEIELDNFKLDDARNYLLKLDSSVFGDAALVQSLYTITEGYPHYLVLAAAVVRGEIARGRKIHFGKIVEMLVPPSVEPDYARERIGDFLISKFLDQLPQDQRDELVFCAVPRELNKAILRVILQLQGNLNDQEIQRRYINYRKFAFTRVIDDKRMALRPYIRKLLLRQMPPDADPQSDYHKIHSSLQTYFQKQACQQQTTTQGSNNDLRIDEAYHALALGNAWPAIILYSQQQEQALRTMLLDAVRQAPTGLKSADTRQRADIARQKLEHAEKNKQPKNPQDEAIAIVLYTWLGDKENHE